MKNFGKSNIWVAIYVTMVIIGCFLLVASQVTLYVTHASLFGVSALSEFMAWGPLTGPALIVIGVYGLYEDHKEAKSEEKKARARHARIAKAKENSINYPR